MGPNRNWLVQSIAMRRYPWRLIFREGISRLGEWIVEKLRIVFKGEEHAFLKFYEKHLNSNCFFGEKIVPTWPDENKIFTVESNQVAVAQRELPAA